MEPPRSRSKAGIVVLGAISVVLAGLWLAAGRTSRLPPETPGDARPSLPSPASDGALSRDRGTSLPGQERVSVAPPPREAEGPAGAPPTEAESREAERMAGEMGRLVRDLEYSPGLREPPQQTVRPPPEPWRPDPVHEGPPPVVESVEPRRGRVTGGDRVVLRGRNLRIVQVMFGQTVGTIVAATGSAVTVETPPSSAGPVAIAVTNDDGTWAVVEGSFIFGE